MCGDYFMIHRLSGGTEQARRENAAALSELVRWTRELGATRILLPLLETSAVDSPELKRQVTESIRSVCPALEAYDVVLGLEMEIPGTEYAALIQGVGHGQVRAYYDTGNSTAQGLNIESDIVPLLPVLEAVHLKDRVSFGTSRPFGKGDANFDGFFAVLARAGYAGDFLTQHFFDAEPEAAATHALSFVRQKLQARKAA